MESHPRRIGICLLLLLSYLLTASCSGHRSDDPEPSPTRTAALNTIEASELGDRLTVTATVVRVLTASSFVVHDVDLPDDGLLVLGGSLTALHPQDLVTVAGTIDLFAFARFRDRFGLAFPNAYGQFEGQKVLVAHDVRSWAAAEPAPPTPTTSGSGAPGR